MPPSIVAVGQDSPQTSEGRRAARDLEDKAREFAALNIPPRTTPPSTPAPVRGPWLRIVLLASALTLTGTFIGWVLF